MKVGNWVNRKVGEERVYVWCVDATGKSKLVRMAKGRNGEMARRKGNGGRGGEGDFIPGGKAA